ncbi:MAG: DUF3823 domain-containing protein [Cyclobacteriaceae bacterium]
MKPIFQYIILFVLGTTLVSCELDNVEPPKSLLTGQIVYQGTPLHLEPNRVSFDLYQDGFGKTGALGSNFDKDGAFSHLLFDGEYKMVIPSGQGPFVSLETGGSETSPININLRGSASLNIEVVPYWVIKNASLSISSGTVSSDFALEQIAAGSDAKNIERVTLYISKTQFANSQTNVATSTIQMGDITDINAVSLSAQVPDLVPAQDYVFASVGVKIAGVDDMIFSPTEKMNL